MNKIRFTESYNKRAKKFFKKHPDLINQYEKVLQLLEMNPNHPSLRLHKLKGPLSNIYSVSINISYRMTMEFIMEEGIIIPIHIGSHQDVY